MAKATKKRRKTSKSANLKRRKTARKTSLAEIQSSMEEMALMDFAKSTKNDLKKLGEQIHETTDKSVLAAKEIAEDVRNFARNATSLTKLKIELHTLKAEREKLYSRMGKKLGSLYRAKKLTGIQTKLKKDFKKLSELDSAIRKNEKLAAKISF